MVHTRHNQDKYEESPGTFLSLETRRSRLSKNSDERNDTGSDDSGVVQFRNQKRVVSRRSDDTTLEKRSLRTSAKRVSYVEDYIDEGFPARRRTRGAIIDDEEEEEEEEAAHEVRKEDWSVESGPEDCTPRSSGRLRRSTGRLPINDTPPEHRLTRSTRRSPVESMSKQLKREELEDIEDCRVRRSTRARKAVLEEHEPSRKRTRLEVDTDDGDENQEYKDMYSRVKRKRISIKRDMYGMPMEESDEGENEEEEVEDVSDGNGSDDEEEQEDEGDNKEEKKTSRGYFLRENKPRTQLYNAPLQVKRPRSQSRFFNEISTAHSPARRKPTRISEFMSPARRKYGSRRHKAFHGDGNSSTSSSSSDSSSDEERFQRRKAKSMMKSRQRILPMNLNSEDITKSVLLRDRQKIGSSLADVDPMSIDRSTTFESVGGLKKHIRALKEMVVFPLMYPEIFERFKISAPRGVLFYGPPGTGKTLVARALANECSSDDRRVAFYMRKGADCLSKWVGESERQLRLLFDQAYQTRPSIIFFDEIDGLAPVRSSRQDQIHSSIVSTLLALMDGLDSRGEIVVIGATNRIDSIDPALRRPGRFDREFLFPLPSVQARTQILKINTKDWNPKLCDQFVSAVAEKCVGYCGADVKALCTEAALLALRRRYPQIYISSEKLQIDVSSINIGAKDFFHGMKNIVPTSQRSVSTPARSLSAKILPLMDAQFKVTLTQLHNIFPAVLAQLSDLDSTEKDDGKDTLDVDACSDDEEQVMAIYEQKGNRKSKSDVPNPESYFNFTSYAHRQPPIDRPRLMLCGSGDQGQTSYLGPAILHQMEQLPVHVLDLPALFANSVRTPEESCAQVFREARRTAPSIIYLPHISQWWTVVSHTVQATLLTLIQDLIPACPVLLLATSEMRHSEMDLDLQLIFEEYSGEVISMRNPNKEERYSYFKNLLLNQATKGPPDQKVEAQRMLEVLPKAPPPEPRKLTAKEVQKLEEVEDATLTELRLFLRDTLNKLGRDRKFFIFTKPVDIEEVPDYYDIIKKPMDLSTMMSKIDLHHYQSVKEFLADINQICLNALEYNPDRDAQSRVIRHRACALRDMAYSIVKAELDPDFEKTCEGINESRKQRGVDSSTAPAFYHTRPLNTSGMHPLAITKSKPTSQSSPVDPNVRISRRLHGSGADPVPSLEDVERNARAVRSLIRRTHSPDKLASTDLTTPQGQKSNSAPTSTTTSGQNVSSQEKTTSGRKLKQISAESSMKKPVRKSIWGRSSYSSRKRKFWLKRRRSVNDEHTVRDEDRDDENNSENDDEVENEEKMDEGDSQEVESELQKSPKGEPSSEVKTNVSSLIHEKENVSDCLTIDVCLKTSKDGSRSMAEKSPKSPSQTSPRLSPSSRSPRSESITGQKSPRQRRSSGHRSPAHSDAAHSRSLRTSSPHKCSKQSKSNSSLVQEPDESSNHPDTQESVATQEASSASGLGEIVHSAVAQFVDSGIGSSDSNGDSNDSAGKLLKAAEEALTNGEAAISNTPESEVINEPMDVVEQEKKEGDSPKIRLTRSRVQTKSQEKALKILQTPRRPVIVDMERLVRLLDLTVLLTEDYTVIVLEKLYSLYSQCIYQHRHDWDKTAMIELMEQRLKQFTSSMTVRLQAQRSASINRQ